jgi:hypothetical protein
MTTDTTTPPRCTRPTEEGAVAAVIRSVLTDTTEPPWETSNTTRGLCLHTRPDPVTLTRTVIAEFPERDGAADDARLVAAAPSLLESAADLLEVAAVNTVALDMLPVDVRSCAIAAASAPPEVAASVSVVAGAVAVMVVTRARRTVAIVPDGENRWRVPSRADLATFESLDRACAAACG